MITLIGSNLAEKGLKFMFYGAANQCEKCRFKATCIESLEIGRIYQVKDVKNTEHPCLVHEGGKVKVVDVDKAPIKTAIDSKKAFEGSNIVWIPPECDEECSMREICFPEGLCNEDKCKIIKKVGKPLDECPKGRNLSVVLLQY